MMIIQLFFQKLFLMYILCAIQAKRTPAGRLADYQRRRAGRLEDDPKESQKESSTHIHLSGPHPYTSPQNNGSSVHGRLQILLLVWCLAFQALKDSACLLSPSPFLCIPSCSR